MNITKLTVDLKVGAGQSIRYIEEQIAFALNPADQGTSVAEVYRNMGISDATFYIGRKNRADWAHLS